MRLRNLKIVAGLVCALGVTAMAGCAETAVIGAKVETPAPPAPPPLDADGDGIPEPPDKCPDAKEDGKAPDATDGCPTTDADGDGIPIPDDKCPDQPETVNGYQDTDGCPDEKPLAEITEKEVKINQKILFAKSSDAIDEESLKVVDAVAQLLKDNSDLQLIEVGGHASQEGDAFFNRSLTQRRVDSVVKALVERGVEKERLLAQGYGFYCLLVEGTTETEHEKNRRVEFKILHRKGKALEDTRGCEAAGAKGVKPPALPAPKPWVEPKAGVPTPKVDGAKTTPTPKVKGKSFKKPKK